MNTHDPPKERAAVLGPPIQKLAEQYYHRRDAAQAARSWHRETERLLQEFRRSGHRSHRQAYMRHVASMRKRLERPR
jgi:biotin-(acetyl-CoA carboxylase) ligase